MANNKEYTPYCQYYAWSVKWQKRILFTWKVRNERDALACLRRNGQSTGWYLERWKHNDEVKLNKRINL